MMRKVVMALALVIVGGNSASAACLGPVESQIRGALSRVVSSDYPVEDNAARIARNVCNESSDTYKPDGECFVNSYVSEIQQPSGDDTDIERAAGAEYRAMAQCPSFMAVSDEAAATATFDYNECVSTLLPGFLERVPSHVPRYEREETARLSAIRSCNSQQQLSENAIAGLSPEAANADYSVPRPENMGGLNIRLSSNANPVEIPGFRVPPPPGYDNSSPDRDLWTLSVDYDSLGVDSAYPPEMDMHRLRSCVSTEAPKIANQIPEFITGNEFRHLVSIITTGYCQELFESSNVRLQPFNIHYAGNQQNCVEHISSRSYISLMDDPVNATRPSYVQSQSSNSANSDCPGLMTFTVTAPLPHFMTYDQCLRFYSGRICIEAESARVDPPDVSSMPIQLCEIEMRPYAFMFTPADSSLQSRGELAEQYAEAYCDEHADDNASPLRSAIEEAQEKELFLACYRPERDRLVSELFIVDLSPSEFDDIRIAAINNCNVTLGFVPGYTVDRSGSNVTAK